MNNPQLAILCLLSCAIGYVINSEPKQQAVAEPVAAWQFDQDDCSCGVSCQCNLESSVEVTPVSTPVEVSPEVNNWQPSVPQGYDCSNGVCAPSSQRRGIFGGLFRR
jgi:hypothetical protein